MHPALFWLALAAQAEQTASDPNHLLQLVRERVLQDANHLQNFTCRQTVTRSHSDESKLRKRTCAETVETVAQLSAFPKVTSWDRLRLDVALVSGKEIYSWAGAPQFREGEVRNIASGDSFGTGDFGPFLASIFDVATSIKFRGELVIGGRKLFEYSYTVPTAASRYSIQMSNGSLIRAGHEGTILIDPDLNDLRHITVRTGELPVTTQNCQAISDIEYARVLVGNNKMLLPERTDFRVIQQNGAETVNTTIYSACREYVGEAVVHFDGKPLGEAPTQRTFAPESVPAGLSFRYRLTTPIDSNTSAAGDEIDAVLLAPLVAPNHAAIAGKGARLHGRLRRLGGSLLDDQIEVEIDFDSIETGRRLPLYAHNHFRFPGKHVVLKGYSAYGDTAAR